jgi:acyl-CoA thioesterase FadM
VRCKFEYKTFNQNGELLNTGETELFFVRKSDLRPIKLPEQYKTFLTI